MTTVCPVISDSAGLAERLAAFVECRSGQIDLAAFQGGLWHGLPTALVSALIALYVAGIGYRLVLHRHLDVAALVYATLRLGMVIAVTTTFSTYSVLVYSVATQGPTELASMALAPAGLRAPSLTEAGHAATETLASLAGSDQPEPVPVAITPAGGGDPSVAASAPAPSPAASGAGLGRAVFILSCVGFGLAARLAQAVVLAVGPLFIAAALFDLSTGLFIGWLRALVALFLAQTGYAVSSALELSFFAQDLAHTSQAASESGEPLLVGLFFLTVGVGITVVAVVAGGGLRPFDLARRIGALAATQTVSETSSEARSPWRAAEMRLDPPVSRAQRISDAVGGLANGEDRRQNTSRDSAGAAGAAPSGGGSAESLAGGGAGLRRPGQLRASTGAAKRDLIS